MSTDNYDTKPTIETVLDRLADFRSSIESRFDRFETRLTAIEDGIVKLNDKFETLAIEIMETKAAQRNLKRRVTELEEKAS